MSRITATRGWGADMARGGNKPRKVDRPVAKKIYVPESVATAVELELWSELEGKVPFGKWSELVEGLLRGWLNERKVNHEQASKS